MMTAINAELQLPHSHKTLEPLQLKNYKVPHNRPEEFSVRIALNISKGSFILPWKCLHISVSGQVLSSSLLGQKTCISMTLLQEI